jgi:hypothetical protein
MKAKNYVTAAARTGMVLLLMMLCGLICQGQVNKGAGGGGAEVAPQVARVDSPATAKQAKTAVDSFKRDSLAYGLTMSIGARLSFLDDKASSELYYDVSGFFPEVGRIKHPMSKRRIKSKTTSRRFPLGIDFGISEKGGMRVEKNASGKKNVIGQIDFFKRINADSVSVLYRTYERTRVLDKELNASIYFSPTIGFSDNVFGLIHFQHEFAQSRYQLQDKEIQTDTGQVTIHEYEFAVSDLESNTHEISSFGSETLENHTVASSFVGLGGILFIKNNDQSLIFRIKPIIGIQYVRYYHQGDRSFSIYDVYNTHFLLDFRIIESKEFGFKLGGVLAGDIYWGSPLKDTNFYAGQPLIYLSKAWDINKVTSFLKPTGK